MSENGFDQFARAIGYVVIAAARLERLVGVLQVHLLNCDLADEVVAGQAWNTAKDVATRLAKSRAARLRGGADQVADVDRLLLSLEEIPQVLKIADDLMVRRNAIIHGAVPVPQSDDTYELASWLIKRGGKVVIDEWPLTAVDDLATQIDAITDEIGRLSAEIAART